MSNEYKAIGLSSEQCAFCLAFSTSPFENITIMSVTTERSIQKYRIFVPGLLAVYDEITTTIQSRILRLIDNNRIIYFLFHFLITLTHLDEMRRAGLKN